MFCPCMPVCAHTRSEHEVYRSESGGATMFVHPSLGVIDSFYAHFRFRTTTVSSIGTTPSLEKIPSHGHSMPVLLSIVVTCGSLAECVLTLAQAERLLHAAQSRVRRGGRCKKGARDAEEIVWAFTQLHLTGLTAKHKKDSHGQHASAAASHSNGRCSE